MSDDVRRKTFTFNNKYVVFRCGGLARVIAVSGEAHGVSFRSLTFNHEYNLHGNFRMDGTQLTKNCEGFADIVFESRFFIVSFVMSVYNTIKWALKK